MSGIPSVHQAGEAQRAFDRARSKIKEHMTAKEFKRLEAASSPQFLVKEAERIAQALETKATSTLESRVGKLASKVKPYAGIVQGFCKLAPKGGDLIWGVVAYLIVAAELNVDILGEVLEFFTGMAEEINHLAVVEDTFGGSLIVLPAIEAVYVAIIKFWMKAIEYYVDKMKTGFRSRIKTWFTSSSAMFDEFVKLKSKIAAQKTTLHEVEASEHHAHEKAERVRRQRKELSDFVDPPDYEHHHHTAREYRHPGTCEWLRRKQVFRDWMDDGTSSLLVICGTAGIGKTILSSWLVDETRSSIGQQTIYHYFKETDDSCNTALAATRSLLFQAYNILLSTNHPLLATLESDLESMSQKRHIHFEPLWNILSSLLSLYSQRPQLRDTYGLTIVLDAMDECKDPRQLIQSLRRLVHASSNNIRVIVTGRRSGDHVDEYSRANTDQASSVVLNVTPGDVKGDIVAFVEHSIMQIDRFRDPKRHGLRKQVIATFSNINHHQGMFLWAYLMCKEVKRPLTESQIRNLLEHLPKDLDGMYARICKRLLDSDETSLEFSRQVLRWIVTSKRPMTFIELEEALKVATADGAGSHDEFFDEDGCLVWSRRDIVTCCGDLVRYTGLDEGDTIAIVHLSAQRFLSMHPAKLLRHASNDISTMIEPFLVNIPAAELKIGITCVKYILSTSLQSDEYFSPPLCLDSARTPGQHAFKKRFPLFDYAAIYWPEYVLSIMQSQPCPDVSGLQQLLATLSRFTQSPTSIIWLEEVIRLTYIESVQKTIRRFVALDKAIMTPNISHWSDLILRVLLEFSVTLLSHPQVVRLCVLHLESMPSDTSSKGILPLEPDRSRCWIRYHSKINKLFSVTRYPPTLKCQDFETGERLRPLLAIPENPLEARSPYHLHRVAISPLANHLAIAYVIQTQTHPRYFTACWSIASPKSTSTVEDWATLDFCDYSDDGRGLFGDYVVAFGNDNTLITPGGVYSIETGHCVDRPTAIYDPDPFLSINSTCFSGEGGLALRIIGKSSLEVLDISGTSINTYEFGESAQLQIQGFSDAGNTVAIFTGVEPQRFCCIVVSEERRIDVHCPWDPFKMSGGLFTKDEGRFAAIVDEDLLYVWQLQDNEGLYYDHADMICVFSIEGGGMVFDLVEGVLAGSVMDALVVKGDGSVTKWPIDARQPDDEDKIYKTTQTIMWKSGSPILTTWTSKHNGILTVEQWSIGSPQPAITFSIEEYMLFLPPVIFQPSPDGNYLNTQRLIIDPHTLSGFGVRALDPIGEMQCSAFSVDGSIFAAVFENQTSTLYVFDISKGPEIVQRAEFVFDKVLSGRLVLSKYNTSLLAVDNYVMRLEHRHLVIHTHIDNVIDGFTECGLYFFDRDLNLYRLSDDMAPTTPLSMKIRYLASDVNFVYPPHMFRLRHEKGIIYLDHTPVPNRDCTRRSRIIWAIPDAMPRQLTLIWPDDELENVRLLVVLDREPKLFDTRIRKGELMKGNEWFGVEPWW